MTDLSLVYREFDKYVQLTLVERDTNQITEDDIDDFLGKFLTAQLFFRHKNQSIMCANNTDPETGEKPYDMTGKSYKEAHGELKPILEAKVRDTYGSVSKDSNSFIYDPQPRSVEAWAKLFAREQGVTDWDNLTYLEKQTHPVWTKAQVEVNDIKSLIKRYFDKVLPFMLRKTMHHPIKVGTYSTKHGMEGRAETFDKDAFGDPVTLNSEKDLQNFLREGKYSGDFPGGRHHGFRYLFWKPSTTGKQLKIAVLDIDNPAGLPKSEVRRATKNIALKLESLKHPYIIMYTGNNFQIWYGAKPGEPIGDSRDSEDYIRTMFFGMASFEKEEAIAKKEIQIDKKLFKSTQFTRMFFSLHYPSEHSKKQFSGLAAVPVPIRDIEKLEGTKYAHPETVYADFDTYASVVAAFFDEVQIGQDYESEGETEVRPPVERLEDRYIEYPALSHIDRPTNSIPVQLADVTKVLADEKSVFAYGKVRGVDAILQYNERGGFKFGNKVLEKLKRREARGKPKIVVEPVKSILVTRTGLVIHSDYITKDLERYCEEQGISELTLVGQLVKTDYLGEALGADETQSTLVAKEGITQSDSKMMHFNVNKVISYGNDPVPLDIMDATVNQITTNRIYPGRSYYFDKPVEVKIKRAYEAMRNSRKGSELVVIGEEKYYITSKRKVSMVILGVDKRAKGYPDAAEIGPVYVGFIKSDRNKGPVYYIVAKAEIALKKEDRIKLKKLIYGKDNENRVALFKKDDDDDFEDDIDIVEPKVVVDVIYDDVSNVMVHSIPTHYLPLSGRQGYRLLPRKAYATKILGAKIVEIREDLSSIRPTDVDYKQDPLITIQGTAPKKGFSIVDVLPNPLTKVDFFSYYNARLKEEPDKTIPYKMTTDSYKKFMKLPKDEEVIGFVKKKQIIYDDAPDWSVLDTDPELMGASFTFKSILNPFHLRGIDIINATKMAVHFGINWHLIFRKNKFYWIYCEIENSMLRSARDVILKSGVKEDKETESILSDMLSTVTDIYPPKEEVEDANVPGFLLDVLPTIELIEKNPAFHGVPQQMDDQRMPVKIDTNATDEPINVEAYGTVVPVYYYGGRTVKPHLFQDYKKTPGEFTKAVKRQKTGEPGYKVFIDEHTLRLKTPAGVSPYYNVTSLPEFMQNAIDEKNQYGMDGINIVTSGNTLKRIKAYKDQLQSHRLTDKKQMKEDLKVVSSKLDYIPGYDKSKPVDGQLEIPPNRGRPFDQHDIEVYEKEENRLKKSLGGELGRGTPFAHLDDSIESLLKNPPVKKETWDALVTNYITEYKNWYRLDGPKQTWEKQSLGIFPAWAVPMLEKEMVLRTVAGKYELTDEEVDTVDLNFASPIGEDILESTLGDLYEEVEVEDDGEYDPEDYEIIEDDEEDNEEDEKVESEIET